MIIQPKVGEEITIQNLIFENLGPVAAEIKQIEWYVCTRMLDFKSCTFIIRSYHPQGKGKEIKIPPKSSIIVPEISITASYPRMSYVRGHLMAYVGRDDGNPWNNAGWLEEPIEIVKYKR